mgnify:CR=1 FL=1
MYRKRLVSIGLIFGGFYFVGKKIYLLIGCRHSLKRKVSSFFVDYPSLGNVAAENYLAQCWFDTDQKSFSIKALQQSDHFLVNGNL